VLGIPVATVILALTGTTSQSARAACQPDAKTYEVAVAAFESSRTNPTNAAPTGTDALVSGGYLHAAANNPDYVVALAGDTGTVKNLGIGTIPAVTTTTERAGTVNVGPNTSLVPFDPEILTTGCGAAG